MGLRLRVTYGRTADFLADVQQQVSRRGLLVRVDVGVVERGAPVELEIATPRGRVVVPANVLQPMPGIGVAVELDPESLAALVDAASVAPSDEGPPPKHELLPDDGRPTISPAPARKPTTDVARPRKPTTDLTAARKATTDVPAPASESPADGPGGDVDELPPPTDDDLDEEPTTEAPSSRPGRETGTQAAEQAKQIQLALHGDKNQRMAILRDQNKMLHTYVLKNPQLTLDEVVLIAKMATVSADMLTQIANRREWAERAEVAMALVRNPKTPVPLAVKMLDHVGMTELRALAKQANVREAIQRAARKKVLG